MFSEVEKEYLDSFKSGISPLKQIDFILNFIKTNSPYFDLLTYAKVVQHTLDNKDSIGITRVRFNQIIKKLEEDGFIEIKSTEDKKYYNITFKGIVFIGYEQVENERIKSDLQAKANQGAIFWLTLIMALGVLTPAVYYLLEVVRNYYNPFLKTFQNRIVPCICLTILILIILLLIQHLRGNKKVN